VFLPHHHQQKLINTLLRTRPYPTLWENQTRFKLLPRIELKQKKNSTFSAVHLQSCFPRTRIPGSPPILRIPPSSSGPEGSACGRFCATWRTNLAENDSSQRAVERHWNANDVFLNRDRERKGPDAHGNGFGGSVNGHGHGHPRVGKRAGAEEPRYRSRDCLTFEFGDGDGDGDGRRKEFTNLDFPLPDDGTSRDNGRFHITTGRIELYYYCYLYKLGRGNSTSIAER
jgi:hypothetical protein